MDEAHNFATPHSIHPSQRRLFCESRKRRCDIFIATQRPNHLNPVVIATATRARLPFVWPDDFEGGIIGGGMNEGGATHGEGETEKA